MSLSDHQKAVLTRLQEEFPSIETSLIESVLSEHAGDDYSTARDILLIL